MRVHIHKYIGTTTSREAKTKDPSPTYYSLVSKTPS